MKQMILEFLQDLNNFYQYFTFFCVFEINMKSESSFSIIFITIEILVEFNFKKHEDH